MHSSSVWPTIGSCPGCGHLLVVPECPCRAVTSTAPDSVGSNSDPTGHKVLGAQGMCPSSCTPFLNHPLCILGIPEFPAWRVGTASPVDLFPAECRACMCGLVGHLGWDVHRGWGVRIFAGTKGIGDAQKGASVHKDKA